MARIRLHIQPVMVGKFKRESAGLYYWTQHDGTVWVIEHVTKSKGFAYDEWHVGTEFDPHADQYGSFVAAVNSLINVAREENAKPWIGKAATLSYPSDCYPLVITGVSKSGKKLTLDHLSTDARLVPQIGKGDKWLVSHYYTEKQIADPKLREHNPVTAYWSDKRQCYMAHRCIPVYVGFARYRRDWSD